MTHKILFTQARFEYSALEKNFVRNNALRHYSHMEVHLMSNKYNILPFLQCHATTEK